MALNKIDTLCDELKTTHEIKGSIHRMCSETAKTLNIDKRQVFAISAQKGLIARVKHDAQLLKDSNLEAMENVLSNEILPQKEQLVRNTLITDINEMMQTSKGILLTQFNSRKKSIENLSGLNGKNENIIQRLLEKTREEQAVYHRNAEALQSSRQILSGQHNRLKSIIDLDRLDKQVNDARNHMKGRWTTTGMKKAGQSRDSISEKVMSLKKEAKVLQKYLVDINKMLTTVNSPMPVVIQEKNIPNNVTAIRSQAGS